MLFDAKNYPNLFIRGKSVNLWFTTIIRKNYTYNQRTKRLRDTSEGETLYFIEVYGQRLIVTFGKYSVNGRDRPVILQFKFVCALRWTRKTERVSNLEKQNSKKIAQWFDDYHSSIFCFFFLFFFVFFYVDTKIRATQTENLAQLIEAFLF